MNFSVKDLAMLGGLLQLTERGRLEPRKSDHRTELTGRTYWGRGGDASGDEELRREAEEEEGRRRGLRRGEGALFLPGAQGAGHQRPKDTKGPSRPTPPRTRLLLATKEVYIIQSTISKKEELRM